MGDEAGERHPERVPGAETATAHEDKFLKYLLNLEHATGGPKAALFNRLGFDESNWDELCDQMLTQLPLVPGRYSRMTGPNVEAYEAIMTITGPNGSARMRTVWGVRPGNATHLITASGFKRADN